MSQKPVLKQQLESSANLERFSLRQHCLSSSVGLMFCFSSAAVANNVNVPVVHPTVVHTSAVHNSQLSNTFTTGSSGSSKHTTNVKVISPQSTSSISALNLGSSKQDVSASLLGQFKSITLDVGGKLDIVKMSSQLTDAEFVAATQSLTGGKQTLTINSSGAATGGSLQLNTTTLAAIDTAVGGSLSSIVIPKHVVVTDSLKDLNLAGSLTNYGTIATTSTLKSGDSIDASSIVNAAGASITSGRNTDLSLNASQNLTNLGTISSGGNLNISSPLVTNSGLVKADNGNVNFTNSQSINIQNTGGTVQASGNINVRDSSYNGSGGINIEGGNLLSQQLNLNSGSGTANVNVNNLTGVVNASGANAHVNAVTENLILGNLNVYADPTYFNQGNITITSALAPTSGSDLAIVASGSITATSGSLNTSNGKGSGGSLTLIAGADFSTSTGMAGGSDDTTTMLTLLTSTNAGGGSVSGGSINLVGSGSNPGITSITTQGLGANASGGDLTMVAFSGSGTGSGTISLPKSVTILTGGSGTGSNGAVTITAGAKSGSAISIGNINTSGGVAGDAIAIQDQVPSVSGPTTITNGTLTGFVGGTGALLNGSITVGNIQANETNISIYTKGAVTFGTIDASGAGGVSQLAAVGGQGGNGGNVTISSNSTVTGGNIFTYGGGGAGGAGAAGKGAGYAGGSGGSGGTVSVSGVNVTLSGQVNSSGGGGGGGGGDGRTSTTVVAGGAAGLGGNVSVFQTGKLVVDGGIFSADGGTGGNGGSGGTTTAGDGGGGGGSYGAGGGGGSAGANNLSNTFGGGGGGGLFGGGGGGEGVSTLLGGNGAGAGQPGVGATPAPASQTGDGLKFVGGTGLFAGPTATNGAAGGALGNGGTALGASYGTLANGGSAIYLSANSQVGTSSTSPLVVNGGTVTAISNGGIYLTTRNYDLVVSSVSSKGVVQLGAVGNIGIDGPVTGSAITIQTLSGSSGNILTSGTITGSKSLTLKADGAGTILEANVPFILTAPTTSIVTSGGAIGGADSPIELNTSNLSFSSPGGMRVNIVDNATTPLNLTASNASQAGTIVTVGSYGQLNINEPVSTNGSVLLVSNVGIAVNANVTAPAGLELGVNLAGNITEKPGLTLTNPGTITFATYTGSVGSAAHPFLLNSTNVEVGNIAPNAARSVYITDTNSAALTTVTNLDPVLNLVIRSAAGSLQYNDTSTTDGNLNISNTSASGSIAINSAFTANNVTLTTVGGNILGGTNLVTVNNQLTFATSSGNIESSVTAPPGAFTIDAPLLTVRAGNNSFVNLEDSVSTSIVGTGVKAGTFDLVVNSFELSVDAPITATNVNLSGPGIGLNTSSAGVITATNTTLQASSLAIDGTINSKNVTLTALNSAINVAAKIGNGTGTVGVTAAFNVFQGASSGLLSGQTVNVTAGNGGIGSSSAPLNVVAPTLLTITDSAMQAEGAYVYSAGSLVLGGIEFNGNLSITAAGTISQSAGTASGATGSIQLTASAIKVLATTNTIGELDAGTNLTLATTGGGSSIVNSGIIEATNAVDLVTPAAGSMMMNTGSTVQAPSLTLQTSMVTLNGTVQTSSTPTSNSGTLDISNPSGSLTVTGTGTLSNANAVSLMSAGNLTLGTGLKIDFIGAVAAPNSISLIAKGTLSLPVIAGTALAVSPDAQGDGGTIIVKAASLIDSLATANGFKYLAPATGTGNNGTIDFTLTGTKAITIGSGPASDYSFTAVGGTGAGSNLNITTGGAITVAELTSIPLNAGGGGNLNLAAGGNLSITGDLTSEGKNATVFGNITLSAKGTKAFLIGAPASPIPVNGISGSIVGADVTVTNLAGITIEKNTTITEKGSVTTFNTQSLINDGTLVTNPSGSALQVNNSSGNLTVTAGSGSSFGTPDALTFTAKSNLTLPATGLNLNANSVTLKAGGVLTTGTATITSAPASGTPGYIDIAASSLKLPTGSSTLTLVATGTSAGGTVLVDLTGTKSLLVGAGGGLLIDTAPTTPPGTVAGTVQVINGGSLTVNSGGITLGATAGPAGVSGSEVLQAGGNLLVSATPVVGADGTLSLTSNSVTPFVIGVPGSNGVQASKSIPGGNLTVINKGGAVTINEALDGVTQTVVTAKTNITSPLVLPAFAVEGATIELTSSGGSIGTSAAPLSTSGDTSISAVTSGAGSVFITNTSASTTLRAGSAGPIFSFTTTGSLATTAGITATTVGISTGTGATTLTLGGNVGNGLGAVTLTNPGTITQTGGSILATTLNLSNIGTTGNALTTNAANLEGTASGSISINDSRTTTVTLGVGTNGIVAPTSLAISSAGAVVVASTAAIESAAITLNAGGAITVDGQIEGPTANAASVAQLNAGGSGAITEGKSTANINAVTLSLSSGSGSIGSTLSPLRIAASTVYENTSGLVNVTDGNGTTAVTLQNVTTPASSFAFNSTGTGAFTVSSVSTTKGSLTLISDATQANGGLTIPESSVLFANSGNITIEDSNTTKGQVVIGQNVTVHASAAATATTLGNVNIVIGPVPSTSHLNATTSITGTTISSTGNGKVYVSDNGITVNGAPPNVSLNAFGRNIILSTDTLAATAVQIGSGAQITADPPAAGSAALIANPGLTEHSNISPNTATVSPANSISLTTASTPTAIFQSEAESSSLSQSNRSGDFISLPTSQITRSLDATSLTLPTSSLVGTGSNASTNGESFQLASTQSNQLLLPAYNNSISFMPSVFAQSNAGQESQIITSSDRLEPSYPESQLPSMPPVNNLLTGAVAVTHSATNHREHKAVFRQLESGAMLIAPDQNTVVSTPLGTVEVSKNALALVVAHRHGLSVYDLDDSHHGSVVLRAGGESISLSPGRHATITNKNNDRFEPINPAQYVSYRYLNSRSLNHDLKAFTSEFHLMSAISGLEPLRQMINSSDPDKKQRGTHLLKTVTILSVLSAGGEQYQRMTAPTMTAMK